MMIWVALIGWPFLVIVFAGSLPWRNALVVSLIGGYLLLPEQGGIDLPLLPPLEKDTIPCLMLLAIAMIMRPNQSPPQMAGRSTNTAEALALKGWLPRSITGNVLLMLVIIGSFMTALTNPERISFSRASFSIPGLTFYDGFSMIVRSTAIIVPLLLGRKYLADARAHRLILMAFVIAALGYSLFALIEIRLSPQMNRWVYGFFPHNWQQHVRGGGYRPLVFLQHGLLLAMFFAMSILSAFGLSRVDSKNRTFWILAGLWLLMTLVLSNSLGALLITIVLLPIVLAASARVQLLAVGVIAAIVLTFPILRSADLVPTQQLVNMAETINESRAASLQFRLENEDLLLEKVAQKPLFGWGAFGRNRIYDDAGRDQSTVDGAWIVAISQGGWLRYIWEFGLLCFPLILLGLNRRRYDVDLVTTILCVVLAANVIDLIPNASRTPMTWLLVGALFGRLELGRNAKPISTDAATPLEPSPDGLIPADTHQSPYTRQTKMHKRGQTSRKQNP